MLTLSSPAKVNLCLDILGKSSEGYHELSTVLCVAENYEDRITVEATKREGSLSIIPDPKNLTLQRVDKSGENFLNRAVLIMKEELTKQHEPEKFAQIIVYKTLPFSSGIGALSSNAATIMMGLNQLWDLKISKEKLKTLGAQLGMDVPFFFEGGICHCTHFGEIVEPIKTDLKFEIEIDLRSSDEPEKTKKSFEKLNLALCGRGVDQTAALVEALKANDKKAGLELIHNDFEQLYPGFGAFGFDDSSSTPRRHLSGAGPSLFTIKSLV